MSVPPHTVDVLLATVNPVGNVSVNATPARGSTFAAGFVMVNVSEVVAFNAIAVGLNALAIDGGASTLMLADAVPPVPPSFEVTALVVLFCWPAAVPVTFTLKVHEVPAARLAPLRLITLVFCVAVMVPPPQLPVNPLGVEIIRPAGNVSLNPTPVSAVVLGLLMVKLRLVEPFSGILAAPNCFWMVADATTLMDAFEVFPVPPSVEVTCTELFFIPAVVPCTLTETVQEALAANVPADRLTEDDPAAAVAVPPQVLVKLGVPATTSPAGRLSVNANPVRVTPVFGF